MLAGKNHIRTLILIALIFGFSTPTLSLDPKKNISQYGLNVWLRQNGLPANAIYVGMQGRDGYLWLGTSAGLFRFDGVNFTSVNTNPADSKIIETISALCRSRDSSLWIGTTFSGLRRIKNEKIFRYGGKEGFGTRQVKVLLESRDGRIWIGSSFGIFVFTDNKFVSVPINPGYITGLAEDSLGRIWVGTHTGVRIFDAAKIVQVDSLTAGRGLPHNGISTIFTDSKGDVWVGTFDGLARWRNGSLKVYKWTDGLADNRITSICEDRNGNLWFGTYKGISRMANGKISSFSVLDGLTNNHVLNIFEDHEGSIWVCTLEGLNRFMDVNITPITAKDGLGSDYVSGIVETPDRNLYFLSDEDGSITQFKDGKFTRHPTVVGPAYVARDGSLWISQTGLLINIKNNIFKRYDTKSGLPDKWMSALTEDDESLVVYVDGIGLRRFVNGKLFPYLLKNGRPYTRLEYIVCMYCQPHGPLWLGSTHGLAKIQNGVDTLYLPDNGLAGPWVNSIYDDHKGSLWICSPTDGLTRYRDGKLTSFSVKDGLSITEFFCILGDDSGDLWMSTPRGIAYLKMKDIDDYQAGLIKTLNVRLYGIADGMKSDECFGEWQPAGWKTHDGNLWFATKKGAVMINPKTISRNMIPPQVLIGKIVIDQASIPMDEFATLSPGSEKFEFHYTALSFLVPERILFKYKLEGYDRDWVEAGTRRVAYYTNLPHRNYRFRVMACNNDGIWNEVGTSFEFSLQQSFYETFWFYSLVLIALVGIIYGIYRLRVYQLVNREKELQRRIKEALASIKTLGGLIPICSNCKKIRDDKGYWDQLEGYIQSHSEVTFSHGICPECAEKLYPEVFKSQSSK